ncbi:hypothetical protein I3842_10G115500 [Carya illinoinensis]|uniref:Retrotransposon gag domain-containing protein n=1 Tax=Carya illinoinensis TaxID=32201 RepID=A0A922DY53_CARIL|nr:hypothetical protein I3842_10G115500 [Carya illinoinensis]
MESRRCHSLAAYLLTIKQKEGESLKAYLSKFNKERLTTDDQDEKITLAALLGGIWPRSPFITELVRKTPSTLREFMDRADDYVNAEDMLQALLEPRKQEMKHDSQNYEGVLYPHNNALVVTLLFTNYLARQILINNESSADILFWEAFIKMGISLDRLRPSLTPLKGFSGEVIQPLGAITLPVMVVKEDNMAMTMTDFLVMKAHSSYNAILGRSTLNNLKAVTSTNHLKIKFPIEIGIGEVRGEQILARECYIRELKASHHQS